jgi:predicted dithiol-disulfide oxidoreductase (DUF899 family)
MTTDTLESPKIASRDVWLEARKKLLVLEKEATRARDALNAQRRALPLVRVEKEYVFDGPDGKETLADLFDTRSQLIVHHFMLGPGWGEECVGCSFAADHIEGTLVHLEHHDVSLVRISRAPLPEIEVYRKRMGWRVKWVSSYNNDFNYDYHVSFRPEELKQGKVYYNYETRQCDSDELSGLSVFYRDAKGDVFHSYSTYGRGDELVDSTYMLLDMTPKGRNEIGPHYNLMDWVRRHDDYERAANPAAYGGSAKG